MKLHIPQSLRLPLLAALAALSANPVYAGGSWTAPITYDTVASSPSGAFILDGYTTVNISNHTVQGSGGAVFCSPDEIQFKHNGSITFKDNKTVPDEFNHSSGGAIYKDDRMIFDSNGDILFKGNAAVGGYDVYSKGGAIYNDWKEMTFSGNGNITFEDNAAFRSGAIFNVCADLIFKNNKSVSFKNNSATSTWSDMNPYGGAIYSNDGMVIFSGNGNINFENNSVNSVGNYVDGESINKGGAILNRADNPMTFSGNGNINFSGNKVNGTGQSASLGGAIFNEGPLTIADNGDINFEYNSVKSTGEAHGGAIYNDDGQLVIAGNGDVTFRGNLEKGTTTQLRSLYSENYYSGKVILSATTGKSITFYDSIHISDAEGYGVDSPSLELNKSYVDSKGSIVVPTGAIVFSGATTEEDLATAFKLNGIQSAPTAQQISDSRTSEFNNAILCGGSLVVKDEAILKGSALTVVGNTQAFIVLDNGQLNLDHLSLGSGNTLQLINGGMLHAGGLSMNNSTLAMDLSGAGVALSGNFYSTGTLLVELESNSSMVDGEKHLLLSAASRGVEKLLLSGLSGSLSWSGNKLYFTYAEAKDLTSQTVDVTNHTDMGDGSIKIADTVLNLNSMAVQNNIVVEGDSSVSGGDAYDGVIEVNNGTLSVEDTTTARALILNGGAVSGDGGIDTEQIILKEGIVAASFTNTAATVEKNTNGTVHLMQENAMAETNVNAGTLVLDADGATGGDASTVSVAGASSTLVNNDTTVLSRVTVKDNATVRGTGNFQTLELINATLKVGDTVSTPTAAMLATFGLTPEEGANFQGIIGTTTVTNLSLDGSVIAMDITRLSDGSAYNDVLSITGTLTATNVSHVVLTLQDSTDWAEGSSLTFQLFDLSTLEAAAQGDAYAILCSMLEVSLDNVEAGIFSIDTTGLGVNGSVTLTAANGYNASTGKALVPEPATGTLSVLALAALAMRRRRKAA